jgi:hypothetical protein
MTKRTTENEPEENIWRKLDADLKYQYKISYRNVTDSQESYLADLELLPQIVPSL